MHPDLTLWFAWLQPYLTYQEYKNIKRKRREDDADDADAGGDDDDDDERIAFNLQV